VPDAVRFGIVQRTQGVAKIEYVVERNHYPFAHGVLEVAEGKPQGENGEIIETQARAFLASYLRRNGIGEV
jgi:hypothetical protein